MIITIFSGQLCFQPDFRQIRNAACIVGQVSGAQTLCVIKRLRTGKIMGSSQTVEFNSIGLNGDAVLSNLSSDIANTLLRLWPASEASERLNSTANLLPTPNGTTLYVNRNAYF